MPYGATIMIELHRINKKTIVKVLHICNVINFCWFYMIKFQVYLQDGDTWSPRYTPLPDCAKNCTWYKFIQTYQKYFATKEMCTSL